MNKNATLMSHLQNAAIAVLTVTAVLLLIQTPLVGDLAGKTPYELAQDWLAGDTSTDTAVTTDLTELALPVRVVFTNEYAHYGLSAITTLDTDFELAGAFFGEALGSATTYEACSGEKLLTALHASSIYLDLEAPTPLEVLSRILGVNDAPESSLLRVTRLVLCPAENGATLYLQDANQGFFLSQTAISSATLREALASLDGNGTDFAFSLSGEFSQLSPYTLIFSEPPQRYTLSAGNTYPAVALPWGMNFWTPQTGEMGDGWAYTYGAHTIRGLKQTHQPSPWINDYGQFSLMPVRGHDKLDEESRQSWFSHQSETAKPYYYSVYLADHDVVAEMTPTERAAVMRFTFPESAESGVVIDAFDRGSRVEIIDAQTVAGYTTRNSGGVPENFRNWFVIRFDKPFAAVELTDAPASYEAGSRKLYPEGGKSVEGDHAVAKVHFSTVRGEQVTARVASSFISAEQALRNLETELGTDDFETVKARAQERWNDVLGRIEVTGGTTDQYRTFYSCLYRSTLFPRKFYELDKNGNPVHYSPYNGEVLPGYMYTTRDSGIRSGACFRC